MGYYEFWEAIMFCVVLIAAVAVGSMLGIYLVLREMKNVIKDWLAEGENVSNNHE